MLVQYLAFATMLLPGVAADGLPGQLTVPLLQSNNTCIVVAQLKMEALPIFISRQWFQIKAEMSICWCK
jgi:hypothetical protein